ncbi:MAP3K epsilon protein kinase 1 [Vitis vinifera]|uniref:MAP3K epsilon protein kinase 1 n=1 Tax=Vitis vinifera TaxID=29760 RepID=A0A438EDC9_VITVI|nr:MAP3K epsilon protein kinase 1 [Vitis vinifera]
MGDQDEALMNGKVGSPKSRKNNVLYKKSEGKGSSTQLDNRLFGFVPRSQENSSRKASLLSNKCGCLSLKFNSWKQSNVFTTKLQLDHQRLASMFFEAAKAPVISGGNELSKFSDTPGDASLEDLFHPLHKNPEDQAAEASTSASSSHVVQGNAFINDAGKNDLATKLRATIAQKQMENEIGQTNGDLFSLMLDVLKEDVMDIDGLVFDDKMPGENLFPLQIVGSLRPQEPEDVIVSACLKLISIFHQRPEQKGVFVTQHGLLPSWNYLKFLELVYVICSVLQIVNQIIKDNTDFQENACLVGLIPVVMSFAVPDHPREVRMEAAYFSQQLCQSSLNEAARLASIAGGSGFTIEGLAPRPRSGSLDPSSPIFIQGEISLTGIDHPDLLKLEYVRHLSGLERHESILPLLHATNEKKTNGELEFSDGRICRQHQVYCLVLVFLNARPGSATSSGLLSHMVSSLNADVAKEYLEKVADLLLEFAQADTTVKSYMCSQSLLSRLFQMFNRIEPPILLKILKCINHLSTDPNCLENLQRADAINT